MKVVVTSQGTNLDSAVDPRFGRAKYFVLVDTETVQTTAHDNTQNLNAPQGAGIQAAQAVFRLGVALSSPVMSAPRRLQRSRRRESPCTLVPRGL